MNEHIESYLKQHYCRDYFNSYGETVEDDHYFMYREEVDGLIELIVRQCGFELVEESLQYNSSLIQEFTVKVANRIKTRFGIE